MVVAFTATVIRGSGLLLLYADFRNLIIVLHSQKSVNDPVNDAASFVNGNLMGNRCVSY